MSKTEFELNIEQWWDSLSDAQKDWLGDKFYKDDVINTFDKVVFCYINLAKQELLELTAQK